MQIGQPLIRFNRNIQTLSSALVIDHIKELSTKSFIGKNVLLALGSRYLRESVLTISQAGGNVFARILPSPLSLRLALSSSLPSNHLAVLKPFQEDSHGAIESALCRYWSIDCIICRQSGGLAQKNWQEICQKQNLDLFLIKKPDVIKDLEIVYSLKSLFEKIEASP